MRRSPATTRSAPLGRLLPYALIALAALLVAAPAPALGQGDRVSGTEKGSLLIYSNVEVRWDDKGRVVRDTFLTLTNDYPQDVMVKLYVVNGDGPLDAVGAPGDPDHERAHPGWNLVDSVITLTQDEPTFFSALTGQPKGLSPLTVLDPEVDVADLPGRPAPDGSGDRVLRALVYAWAIDVFVEEISWNHLAGSATVVDYRDGAAWEYNAWAFQVVSGAAVGMPTGVAPAGRLDLDGVEYTPGFSLLELDFYAAGSAAFTGGGPLQAAELDTALTLHPVDADLRQDRDGPITTKASFLVWNENETQFSGLHRCLTCWDQTFLSVYSVAANHFLLGNLQTDKGKARIDGVASTVCSSNCCLARPVAEGGHPGCADFACQEMICAVDPDCCAIEWDEDCVWASVQLCDVCDGMNAEASLLGIAARRLTMNGFPTSATAVNLIGMGTQPATIRYDVVGGPPPPGGTAPPPSGR